MVAHAEQAFIEDKIEKLQDEKDIFKLKLNSNDFNEYLSEHGEMLEEVHRSMATFIENTLTK